MVRFRPHKLRIIVKGEGAYDEKGDWQEGASLSSPVAIKYGNICVTYQDTAIVHDGGYIPCRYEPNGSAQTITLPDGTAYRYSYTIYLSVNPSLGIQYGDLIELTSQDGDVIAEAAEVKGFHRGQLDMKIWV